MRPAARGKLRLVRRRWRPRAGAWVRAPYRGPDTGSPRLRLGSRAASDHGHAVTLSTTRLLVSARRRAPTTGYDRRPVGQADLGEVFHVKQSRTRPSRKAFIRFGGRSDDADTRPSADPRATSGPGKIA